MWNNTLGIVRYNASSKELPTTTNPATSYPYSCDDEPMKNLVPHLKLRVPKPSFLPQINLYYEFVPMPAGFLFTLNHSYIWVNFSAPTNLLISEKDYNWPNKGYPDAGNGFTDYNTVPLAIENEWVYFALQDISHRNRSHPMHLHGHDYWVLAQGPGNFTSNMSLTLSNPPRRDVATLPKNGHMVMAFKTDNPGSWLMHCHISAHSSEGLGLQFVEVEDEITSKFKNEKQLVDTCQNWWQYWNTKRVYVQEDSGI